MGVLNQRQGLQGSRRLTEAEMGGVSRTKCPVSRASHDHVVKNHVTRKFTCGVIIVRKEQRKEVRVRESERIEAATERFSPPVMPLVHALHALRHVPAETPPSKVLTLDFLTVAANLRNRRTPSHPEGSAKEQEEELDSLAGQGRENMFRKDSKEAGGDYSLAPVRDCVMMLDLTFLCEKPWYYVDMAGCTPERKAAPVEREEER
eukprot:2196805-Rhodomonas_salina.3